MSGLAMSSLTVQSLTPFVHMPKSRTKISPRTKPSTSRHFCHLVTERRIQFDTGGTFFRHESATGRDLGVLAASLYKESHGGLRVLDALCGCGIRSLRYLVESEADFVLANDASEDNRRVILRNLSAVERGYGDRKRWSVTHFEAARLLTERYLQKDFFDFIDVDSFGSDSSFFMRPALNAVKFDGLLYVTSTDGLSSGGHRPFHTLSAYGAYVRPMPYANEMGLRMLIGGAVREASVLGYNVTPVFSYYSFHGPVFRVLLKVRKGKLPGNGEYGFIYYCIHCGDSQAVSWNEVGHINCPCTKTLDSSSLVLSGPLWTGPLHNAAYVMDMLNLAEQWGWVGSGTGADLEKVLRLMLDESDPRLPAGYIKLDEVASRAKVYTPPIRTFISTLRKEGFIACRSHIASNAIKTNCPMAACIRHTNASSFPTGLRPICRKGYSSETQHQFGNGNISESLAPTDGEMTSKHHQETSLC